MKNEITDCKIGVKVDQPGNSSVVFDDPMLSEIDGHRTLPKQAWNDLNKREGEKALDKQIGGDHYKNMAIQPIEFCFKNNLNVCQSKVVKYITRYKNKDGKKDLEKAKHIIDLLIEMEYPKPQGSIAFGRDAVATS